MRAGAGWSCRSGFSAPGQGRACQPCREMKGTSCPAYLKVAHASSENQRPRLGRRGTARAASVSAEPGSERPWPVNDPARIVEADGPATVYPRAVSADEKRYFRAVNLYGDGSIVPVEHRFV